MNLTLKTENCSYDNPCLTDLSSASKVMLSISFPNQIPTSQSKDKVKKTIIKLIQDELTKFKWISFGAVWIELTWFLDSADRQESTAIGDLDNITKPILDALNGFSGIIVDDTQTKSIYTRWLAKRESIQEHILEISIEIINDDVLEKERAYFIQYFNAMCFIIDLNPYDENELKAIKLFASAKRLQRGLATNIKAAGAEGMGLLIGSQKDFHRTRLSGVPNSRIFQLPEE